MMHTSMIHDGPKMSATRLRSPKLLVGMMRDEGYAETGCAPEVCLQRQPEALKDLYWITPQ